MKVRNSINCCDRMFWKHCVYFCNKLEDKQTTMSQLTIHCHWGGKTLMNEREPLQSVIHWALWILILYISNCIDVMRCINQRRTKVTSYDNRISRMGVKIHSCDVIRDYNWRIINHPIYKKKLFKIQRTF